MEVSWADLDYAGWDGNFMPLLAKLPRQRWTEQDEDGYTLLHHVCCSPNVAAVVALLRSGLVDGNTRGRRGYTPAHSAASYTQSRVLEVLCAVDADLRARTTVGFNSPIDNALWNSKKDDGETVRVLVANGVRLSTVREDHCFLITPELEAFEHGVLRCRAAVVAMLRVKKAAQLYHVDKFLMRELAYAMWATRTDERWQTK